MASMQPASGVDPFGSSKGLDHVQNWLGSELDGLVRIWPNASRPKASRCARITGPSFRQNATSLLLDSVAFFHRTSGKPGQIWFGSGWPCRGFWPNGSGPEVSRCARIIRPCFWADPDQIWHVYWESTSLPNYRLKKELVNLCDCASRFVFKWTVLPGSYLKRSDYIFCGWKVGYSDSRNKGLYNIYILYQDALLLIFIYLLAAFWFCLPPSPVVFT